MTYRNERFNTAMLSLELMIEGVDPEKCSWLGDGMAAVSRMIKAVDGAWPCAEQVRLSEAQRADKISAAVERLVSAGEQKLIPVLLLIISNGRHRKESMKHCSRRTYFRARAALLKVFGIGLD